MLGEKEEGFLQRLMRCIDIEERGVDGRGDFSFTLRVGGSSISLMSNGDIEIISSRDIRIKVGRHLFTMREHLSFDKCDPIFIEEAITAYEEGPTAYSLFLLKKGLLKLEAITPIDKEEIYQ